jgi:membrane protease YdiL (CAAX protease family)
MDWRSPGLAHVVPLASFLAIGTLGGFLDGGTGRSVLWIYPLQAVLGLALVAIFWRGYDFGPVRPGGLLLAVLMAPVAFVLWIAPSWLQARFGAPGWMENRVPGMGQSIRVFLGLTERWEGFNPAAYEGTLLSPMAGLAFRFLRLAVAVPLVEEICWRGYVMRLLDDPDRPFSENPFGRHRWRTCLLVTTLVVLVHPSADWFGALCFGLIVYFLAVKTKSLGLCVVFHALVNLWLGGYVLATRQWGYW